MISLFHTHHLPGFENPRHDVNRKEKKKTHQINFLHLHLQNQLEYLAILDLEKPSPIC
jgi:hypothetical protein